MGRLSIIIKGMGKAGGKSLWKEVFEYFAQFIGVCSSAKTCAIDENLRSVSDPILRLQERLIHAGALIRPPTLQRRPVSSIHPYPPMERSPSAMPSEGMDECLTLVDVEELVDV
jgi:hypothetical protein